jgi:hypothetical protein
MDTVSDMKPKCSLKAEAGHGLQGESSFWRVQGVATVLLQEINTDIRECSCVNLLEAKGARSSSTRLRASICVNAEFESGCVHHVGKSLDAARELRQVGDKDTGFVAAGEDSIVEVAAVERVGGEEQLR